MSQKGTRGDKMNRTGGLALLQDQRRMTAKILATGTNVGHPLHDAPSMRTFCHQLISQSCAKCSWGSFLPAAIVAPPGGSALFTAKYNHTVFITNGQAKLGRLGHAYNNQQSNSSIYLLFI